ncbi:PI-PLC X domain-containing protein 3-like [Watersipora subatra]|uniref:PI-PLC X domain-containing protein 3-like n=1 Tax=Watersipora subatra TaxID=2589382 RepID=UPI00355BC7A6
MSLRLRKTPVSKDSLKHSKSSGDMIETTITPACHLHIQALLFPRYNTATWMHDLYKNCPTAKLNEIAIPGSHDSATDMMTSDSPYAKFNKYHRVSQDLVCMWAKTQHHSIYDQLMDGIRYLDLRLENHTSGWKTFHGLLSNCLIDVLDEIGRFATNHNREIIILDFQHLVNFEFADHIELMEYIIKHHSLGNRLAGNHLGVDGCFSDFWNADKNVIIMYSEGYRHFSHLYWHRCNSIDSPWYNTPSKSTLVNKLMQGISRRDSNKFHVSQLILTPDALKVVSGLVFGVSSLFGLTVPGVSNLIAGGLVQNLDSAAKQAGQKLNIVIVDFYEHSSFVEQCLDVNSENLQL